MRLYDLHKTQYCSNLLEWRGCSFQWAALPFLPHIAYRHLEKNASYDFF